MQTEPAEQRRPPTAKQLEVMREIKRGLDVDRCPPSWAEMGERIGVETSAIQARLKWLRVKGLVAWASRGCRTTRLTDEGERVLAEMGGA